MTTSSLKTIITLLLLCNIWLVKGQTGIFSFLPTHSYMPNGKTVSITESENGNIMMLNQCSDVRYLNHSLEIIITNLNGLQPTQKTLDINNLYDVNKIEIKNPNEFSIFGNTSLNKSFEPFQQNILSNGEKISNIQLPQVYSTLISDVLAHENNFMILYSKVGKNKLYNISLHKVDAETGNVEWLKKISSENNEEADKIIATNHGDFYILGKKYNDAVTKFIPIIYKIDSKGNQLWKRAIDVPSNFNNQSIKLFENDELIYVCGFTQNPTGFSETKVIKLSNSGEEIENTRITDFSANGIIEITNNSYLIFGSKFTIDKQQVVTKGKFVLIDKQLKQISTKTLDKTDKPDVLIKGDSKTSSDFLCAYKLSNNKMALGGKVFMPVSDNLEEKNNVPLLMIINNDGSYIK
jgi:hypothetical protein